jgi:hypothetical protein
MKSELAKGTNGVGLMPTSPGEYFSSLNQRPISQIDFWGRNQFAPKVAQ